MMMDDDKRPTAITSYRIRWKKVKMIQSQLTSYFVSAPDPGASMLSNRRMILSWPAITSSSMEFNFLRRPPNAYPCACNL